MVRFLPITAILFPKSIKIGIIYPKIPKIIIALFLFLIYNNKKDDLKGVKNGIYQSFKSR